MPKEVRIYPPTMDREAIALARAKAYQQLSPKEKLESLCQLIALTVKLNGGQPIKQPQGKGLTIRKIRE